MKDLSELLAEIKHEETSAGLSNQGLINLSWWIPYMRRALEVVDRNLGKVTNDELIEKIEDILNQGSDTL
jgi:hypothetical protein